MSSTYRVLCVSHDPAMVLEFEQDGPDARAAAEARAADPVSYEVTRAHAACDLLIGRWSGSLVEVGCPSGRDVVAASHYPEHPHTSRWVEVEWLRLLHFAMESSSDRRLYDAVTKLPGCWSWTRLSRMRFEMGLVPESGAAILLSDALAARAATMDEFVKRCGQRRKAHPPHRWEAAGVVWACPGLDKFYQWCQHTEIHPDHEWILSETWPRECEGVGADGPPYRSCPSRAPHGQHVHGGEPRRNLTCPGVLSIAKETP